STISVVVTDSMGLVVLDQTVFTAPASVPMGMAMVTDTILCNGDSTGGVMVNVMGGTAPFTYSWNTMDSTDMAMNLPAGAYNVTVADSFGCTFDATATVTEPSAIAVALDSLIDVQCPDDMTGAINISVSGGTAGYTFSWSNGATTEDIMMLGVGDYTGVITDANGCMLTSPTLSVAATDTFPTADFNFMPGDVDYQVSFMDMSSNADSVRWDFGDGTTSTDPNPSYSYATNSSFTVTMIAFNACGTDTSTQTVDVTNVSIENDLLSNAVQVYPNPNSGTFDIEFSGINLDNVALSISNTAGQMVYTRNISQVRGNYTQKVQLPGNIATGLYILEIRTPDAVMHQRLIVE
ncbi:MAG: PKD domain-containing protein, partial [Bacteroidota bacterium]